MNCKTCNTRLPGGQKVCPNCGHSGGGILGGNGGSSAAKASKSSAVERLSPSNLVAFGPGADSRSFAANETELEQEIDMAPKNAPPTSNPRSDASGSEGARKPVKKRKKESDARATGDGSSASNRSPVNVTIPVDPEQVRHLIVERPEVLEANLAVVVDSEGLEVGAGFETEVGEIDLLARSEAGDWVVTMVVPTSCDQEMAIAGMIQRLGWVEKHLSQPHEIVRGIVLTGWTSSELAYAATALRDSVSFLGWRLSLGFESLAP